MQQTSFTGKRASKTIVAEFSTRLPVYVESHADNVRIRCTKPSGTISVRPNPIEHDAHSIRPIPVESNSQIVVLAGSYVG